jgi:hypothetical protein
MSKIWYNKGMNELKGSEEFPKPYDAGEFDPNRHFIDGEGMMRPLSSQSSMEELEEDLEEEQSFVNPVNPVNPDDDTETVESGQNKPGKEIDESRYRELDKEIDAYEDRRGCTHHDACAYFGVTVEQMAALAKKYDEPGKSV